MRSHDYLNCLAFHGFLAAHSIPTRGDNCLDHLILRTNLPSHSFVFDSVVTDHYPSLLCLENCYSSIRNGSAPIATDIDYEKLDETMSRLDFDPVLSIANADMATDKFVELVTTAISKHTTTRKVSARKKKLKPWITTGLIRCIRNRDALHKKAKQDPENDILALTYKRYRNFCTKILKKAKRLYDTQELDKAGQSPKLLWETIKRVTYTTKSNNTSTQLLTTSSSLTECCNKVNSFFVNVGKNLADNITSTSSQRATTVTQLTPTSSFVLEHTDNDEIISTIHSLRTNAATGWDGISPFILKKYSTLLAPILCHIFNICFDTAVFPTSFKKAIIHPIFKGGDGTLPNNYRPIAVLTALSKVLERLINKRLVNYLEHYKLISSNQFGFRRNVSTCDAVHKLTNHVIQSINNNKKVLTIFLDLAKAFDTVPVSTLLLKLEGMGVRGVQLELFRSYLTNRSQFVRISNNNSNELPIYYGVPQGSILGPTLFLVFINGLCDLNIQNATIISFADDTAITIVADTWPQIEIRAQLAFSAALNWLSAHTLTLNTSKTKFLTYSKSAASQPNIPITIKAHFCHTETQAPCICPTLTAVDHIKYLGVTLDKNLNFKSHINILTGRVRKLIFIFYKLRKVANQIVIRNVYFALCQSIVTYCISCWGGAAKTIIKQLEIAHRAVLKVATFRPIIFPTNELYSTLGILNVRQHFIIQAVLLQHKLTPYRTINKRRKDLICTIPQTRSPFIKRFFYFLGPSLYNKINKHCPVYGLTYNTCKKMIYSFLLHHSYEDTEKMLI